MDQQPRPGQSGSTTSRSDTPQRLKRKKATHACIRCRQKKLRCDSTQYGQTCDLCRKVKHTCEWGPAPVNGSSSTLATSDLTARVIAPIPSRTPAQETTPTPNSSSPGSILPPESRNAMMYDQNWSSAANPGANQAGTSTSESYRATGVGDMYHSSTSWNTDSQQQQRQQRQTGQDVGLEGRSHVQVQVQQQSVPHSEPRVNGNLSRLREGAVDQDSPRSHWKTTGIEPRFLGSTAVVNLLSDIRDRPETQRHDRRFGQFRLANDFLYSANLWEGPQEELIDDTISYQLQERLLDIYATRVAPLHPVLTPTEARALTPESSPALVYVLCGIAAHSRDVPYAVYQSVRSKVAAMLVSGDVLLSSTTQNIQTLLIYCMSCEMNGQTAAEGGSIAWLRVATPIRMAQDLGLHLAATSRCMPQLLEKRNRLWLSCIIADRCYSCAYGQPFMIDLADCSDPLENESLMPVQDSIHLLQRELFHLSELLRRTSRLIYPPGAKLLSTDEELAKLLADIDRQIVSRPDELGFQGPATDQPGGMLNLMTACVEMMFFKRFIKSNATLPPHITWRPKQQRWYSTVLRARAAIVWMSKNGSSLIDTWYLAKYGLVYCALAQFYAAEVLGDTEAVDSLRLARDCMARWARGNDGSMIHFRGKIADIASVLYEAVRKEEAPVESQPYNNQPDVRPTAAVGVSASQTDIPLPEATDHQPPVPSTTTFVPPAHQAYAIPDGSLEDYFAHNDIPNLDVWLKDLLESGNINESHLSTLL